MNTTIRGLDESAYRSLKARAALEGRPIGELVSDAIRGYLAWPAPREKTGSLLNIKPIDLGPGTEHISDRVDEILYDEEWERIQGYAEPAKP
jgi:plasmid stability protein